MAKKTRVAQRQIDSSRTTIDSLPLEYENPSSLEDDLNYVRSIIRDLKGTSDYNSPLTRTLEQLNSDLAAAVFENAQLTGEPTAAEPELIDYSNRVATTKYVTDKILEELVAQGADKSFVHEQIILPPAIDPNAAIKEFEWTVNHNLGKFPAVTVVRDGFVSQVFGIIQYDTINRLYLRFSEQFTGKAYLN